MIEPAELPEPGVVYNVRSNLWRLRDPYFYEEPGFGFVVPAGFEFDLASIPRIAWAVVACFELSIAAPALHDYLYRTGGRPKWVLAEGRRAATRQQADEIFNAEMIRRGVPAWRRVSAYLAVRCFGAASWGAVRA